MRKWKGDPNFQIPLGFQQNFWFSIPHFTVLVHALCSVPDYRQTQFRDNLMNIVEHLADEEPDISLGEDEFGVGWDQKQS